MLEFASMGNAQETMTRRKFIVYHVSPFLTAAGILAAGSGGATLLNANRTRDDFRTYLRENTRTHIEDTECAPIPVEEKPECIEQAIKKYDGVITTSSEQKWVEFGGLQAESKTRIGIGVLALGVGIKLFDSFIHRRSLQKQKA